MEGTAVSPTDPLAGPFPQINVVCTDRGQHAPFPVNELSDQRGADPPGVIVGTYVTERTSKRHRNVIHDRPDPISMLRPDGSRTFTFPCGYEGCPRNVERRMEVLGAELDRFYTMFPADQRRFDLDISYMD